MIYITYTTNDFLRDSVKNVWETKIDNDDAEERYKRFMIQISKDRFHIVINPH